MAQAMPTVVRSKNQRQAGKQNLNAHLQLTKLADPIYNALTEYFTFNLSLEAVTVYNLCQFVDSSVSDELTSSKLRSHVLYLETQSARYELARFTDESFNQIYRLSVVKEPHLRDDNFFSAQN